MIDIAAIRQAIADQLDTIDGLRVYPYVPGQVQTPCAVIHAEDQLIRRERTFGPNSTATLTLRVAVLVRQASSTSAQKELDTLAVAAPRAVIADRKLGGLVHGTTVTNVTGYETVEISSAEALGLAFDVEMLVEDDG